MLRFAAAPLVLGVIVAVFSLLAVPTVRAQTMSARDPCKPAPTQLEALKTCEELRNIRLENQARSGWRGIASSVAGLAGVLGAVGVITGVLLTFRAQRLQQANERLRDFEERQRENQRALNERFAAILTDLGSGSPAAQASAAASLLSFVDSPHLPDAEQETFNRQVRLAVLANLKVDPSPQIRPILIGALEAALRVAPGLTAVDRDFARADLRQADLAELDLREADLAFANLERANLTNANLWRARGIKIKLGGARVCGPKANLTEVRFKEALCERANFQQATLVSAHLEGADLTGAQFQQAKLQAAHLDKAILHGARFEQADLRDTYFRDAEFDEGTLRSITRALNWQKAHFSSGDMERLQSLAAVASG